MFDSRHVISQNVHFQFIWINPKIANNICFAIREYNKESYLSTDPEKVESIYINKRQSDGCVFNEHDKYNCHVQLIKLSFGGSFNKVDVAQRN